MEVLKRTVNNITYLDNAATMAEDETRFNVNSMYASDLQKDLWNCRYKLSEIIGCEPDEIYFTSGGAEANSWALQMVARNYSVKGNHIITSCIEHPSIMNCCKELEKEGFEITYLPVDKKGLINTDDLRDAIRSTTILISIMTINNEIGTVQPITAIGMIAKEHNILFHTDAVQAFANKKLDVSRTKIDMMSVSGHKFGAPTGVGFLYCSNRVKMSPIIFGGEQERGMRGGTTNYLPIKKMADRAYDLWTNNTDKIIWEGIIKSYLEKELKKAFPNIRINTPMLDSGNSILSVSFNDIDSQSLMQFLSEQNVYVSAGSACCAGEAEPSHVLKAIKVPDEYINGTIRISFSVDNTKDDCDKLVELIKIYKKLC